MDSKLREIFNDHWGEVIKLYGYRTRKIVFKEVEKMMNCGFLSIGYVEYRCSKC